MKKLLKFASMIILIHLFRLIKSEEDELFQRDIGRDMKIGLSDKGYKSVQLKCGSDSMQVELETDEDFEGVVYTRGSYHDRKSGCFLDPGHRRGQRSFTIKFALDKCQTKKAGEVYSNILVLQHDKELIMPGDAAFNLECDFNKPRDITVNANLQNEKGVVSRITLSDADPSVQERKLRSKRTVENDSNTVILTPEFFKRQQNDQQRVIGI